MVLITDNQRNLTLGAAVVTALRSALKEDENLSESVKLDHMEWAVKVRAAENALASVEFSNEHMARIKDRVNKCFPAPEVVWRLDQALKADKPTLVKTA